jgi:DNA polymerase III subunit delta'
MTGLWEGFYGQEQVKEILQRLISSEKIPHALLFTGSEGTGKYFCALKFALALNSHLRNSELDRSILSLSEPYIKYIFPLPRGKNENDTSSPYEKLNSEEIQAVHEQLEEKRRNPYHKISIPKANLIKISSIRDIKKFLSFNYQDVAYRIVIISDAHLMNEESQNALLKNLEEPPEGIIFILTTPYPMILRETIRSRCWMLNFQPLRRSEVKEILVKNFSMEAEQAELASFFANGSVISAIKAVENDLNKLLEKTISVLRYSFGRKINSAFKEINELLEENDPETFRLLVQFIITWLNDVLRYRTGIKDLSFRNYSDTIEKFSTKFPDADITGTTSRLEYLASLLRNNVNLSLITLNLVFTLQNLVTRISSAE